MTPDFSSLGRSGGMSRSAAKAEAARVNGRRGGWPKGRKRGPRPDVDDTIASLARAARLPAATVRSRLAAGWSRADALSKPSREYLRRATLVRLGAEARAARGEFPI